MSNVTTHEISAVLEDHTLLLNGDRESHSALLRRLPPHCEFLQYFSCSFWGGGGRKVLVVKITFKSVMNTHLCSAFSETAEEQLQLLLYLGKLQPKEITNLSQCHSSYSESCHQLPKLSRIKVHCMFLLEKP